MCKRNILNNTPLSIKKLSKHELDEYNTLNQIKCIINEESVKIDNKIVQRKRKLDSSSVLQMILDKSLVKDKSYEDLVFDCKFNNYDITPAAILKKRKLLPASMIHDISSRIRNEICIPDRKNKIRYLAVDGTQINLDIQLLNEGFTQNKPSQKYVTALVSCIYDIENDQLISYHLCNHGDERLALIEQL